MAYSEITWPSSLPQKPQKNNYEESFNMSQIISSVDFDAGPTRQRRRPCNFTICHNYYTPLTYLLTP